MGPAASTRKTFSPAIIIVAVLVVLGMVAGLLYLSRPVTKEATPASASPEVKAYLPNLQLSDVTIRAAENLLQQKVVEVQGKISNNGPRALRSVEVYCIFYGVDRRQIHRERASVVPSTAAPVKPGETRAFRLPFDALPEGWNQSIPVMVIANIKFAS